MKDMINGQPEQDIDHCATCIHATDSEDICILRKCKYAIAELKDCYEPKQPEHKRGEWDFFKDIAPVWDIEGETTWARTYKCSECGFVHTVIEDFGRYVFCPNCGADMRWHD